VLVNSALDFPGCNVAVNLSIGAEEDPAALVARMKGFFAQRGRGALSIITRKHADQRLTEYCTDKKMYRVEGQLGMVLDQPVKTKPASAGAALQWVNDAQGMQDYSDIVSEAFQELAFPLEISRAYFAHAERVLNPYSFMAVVRLDGKPVSAAMIMLTHGIAGVYWVGTLKEARCKGLAEYCTREVSNAAFDLGARKVILQASRFGEPVYRRMGYRDFTNYPWFICSSK
jgi:ribosomal protein S18 acetylase RimI-like enzyme